MFLVMFPTRRSGDADVISTRTRRGWLFALLFSSLFQAIFDVLALMHVREVWQSRRCVDHSSCDVIERDHHHRDRRMASRDPRRRSTHQVGMHPSPRTHTSY